MDIIDNPTRLKCLNKNGALYISLNSLKNTRKKGRHFFIVSMWQAFFLQNLLSPSSSSIFLLSYCRLCVCVQTKYIETSSSSIAARQTFTFADRERRKGGWGDGSQHRWPSSRSSKWRHEIANDVTHARMCVPWVCYAEKAREGLLLLLCQGPLTNQRRPATWAVDRQDHASARLRKAKACLHRAAAATISKKVWENLNVSEFVCKRDSEREREGVRVCVRVCACESVVFRQSVLSSSVSLFVNLFVCFCFAYNSNHP